MQTKLSQQDSFDASKCKYKAISLELEADMTTPMLALTRLTKSDFGSLDYFFYDSVITHSSKARYSVIAIGYNEKHSLNSSPSLGGKMESLVQNLKVDTLGANMPDFVSSYFFYLSYNCTEALYLIDASKQTKDISIPDCVITLPKYIVYFDKLFDKLTIVAICQSGEGYINAKQRLQNIKDIVLGFVPGDVKSDYPQKQAPISEQSNIYTKEHLVKLADIGEVKLMSDTSKQDYLNKVKKCIDYARDGDCFQIVPSLRLVKDVDEAFEPLAFYRALRGINPSPFMFCVKIDDFYIIGSSPEIMVRVKNNEVFIKPLAGTRPKGKNEAEDKQIAAGLLADQKEVSEHLILLDLARNDVGCVCKDNSVEVVKQMEVEFYSHVMHISSTVKGVLREDKSVVDAMFAGFPAGTLSGGPKIRAMQIIAELESVKRCFYSGCLGYINKDTLETCIMLRTALVKDNKVFMQAGAGVVYHSEPQSEYNECINKMMALIKSLYLSKEFI
jgi:anthranilate synthase component I